MEIAPVARPPRILQIVREPLKPGCEAAYSAIEEDTARISAALGCPHPYLGAECVVGSPEVWWFNGYESAAEQAQVAAAYAKNMRLLAAVQQNGTRKASLTRAPIEAFAIFREDASVGAPWVLGAGRFLVITVSRSDVRMIGTVFEAAAGVRYRVTATQTRDQADAAHARAGGESYVLAVRPDWSFPARDWIESDPALWQPHRNG
jgi:hypothetical protein